MDTGGFFFWKPNGWVLSLTSHLHLITWLKMRGVLLPLPLYALMNCTGAFFSLLTKTWNVNFEV
jgi:hypothetical protein